MSHIANSALEEEGVFYAEYLVGTTLGKMIEQDLKSKDLDGLYQHINEARQIAFDNEFNLAEDTY